MTLQERIRALGPVLDMEAVRAMYAGGSADRVPEGMRVERDVAYGAHPLQRLDAYVSLRPPPSGAPVVVMVHGGGFIRGDKTERTNGGIHFAKHGFVTLVPNYRLAPADGWPAGALDIGAVWRWAAREGSRLGGDPRRIVLVGESAGATHIAAATLIRRFRPEGVAAPAGVVLISGPYDPVLEHAARAQFQVPTPDPRNDAYYGADPAELRSRSVIDHIDVEPFPLLITFAELDLVQMQVQAGALFTRLVRQHGFAPQIAMIRDHNHLSQCFSLNTPDDALAAPLDRFLAQVTR